MNVVVLARTSALPPELAPTWAAQLTRALRERGQSVAMVDGGIDQFPPNIRRKSVHTATVDAVWHSGAQEVLLAHASGAALLTRFESVDSRSPDLAGLIGLLDPRIDWVLAVGFDQAGVHKLECSCPHAPERPLYPDDPFVAALVVADANAPLPEATLRPLLPLHDAGAVADWLLADAGGRFDWVTQQGGGPI